MILKNGLDVPTHRERYGHAVVRVKGEPLCQLRQWTLSEPYAGGGRDATASARPRALAELQVSYSAMSTK